MPAVAWWFCRNGAQWVVLRGAGLGRPIQGTWDHLPGTSACHNCIFRGKSYWMITPLLSEIVSLSFISTVLRCSIHHPHPNHPSPSHPLLKSTTVLHPTKMVVSKSPDHTGSSSGAPWLVDSSRHRQVPFLQPQPRLARHRPF